MSWGNSRTRTLEEAQLEVQAAQTFRRAPAAWAVEMVSTSTGAPDYVALFREAGFSQENAESGARRMRSGRYLGFEDVAASLATFHRAGSLRVTEQRIAEVAARIPGAKRLEERRTALQARPMIIESAVARAAGEAKLHVVLIDAGDGSSGHYPASTLQEAAGAKVFHQGVHCYVDHPSASEAMDRPERSLKDLAGELAGDAVYRDGGLHAEVRVFSSHREFITERASTIGMSIRADGEISKKTSPTGRPIISRLTKAHSVDFVTKAGRGGRIAS